ncbi:MAG: carbohydrate ABC transporter permease [Eubacteriales bacterium]|nr:carbohydrate ABC transporter permease [Eubacteriales bacterium]
MVGAAVLVAILTVIGCMVCFPFFWMLLSSFKTNLEIGQSVPTLFPKKPTMENFEGLFADMNFAGYLKNTLIITLYSMLSVAVNSMAGYAFAKFVFRGRQFLFVLVLATMMIPAQVTMIPMYLIMNQAGLTDTFTGIVLPGLAGAFAIFLFRQFIGTISDDFLEAARIDGAGELYIFARIVVPLTKPIVSLQIILTFINGWNSFLWPLIMSNDDGHYTLSVGLALLQNMYAQDFALLMAGASLMILPVIIVYAVFQKQIIKGISLNNYK